jgi:predicted PurR-regulated permease PerM
MVLWVLWQVRQVLLLAFAGLLLAILMRIPSDWLKRRTALTGRWALSVTLLLYIALVGGAIWLVSPSIIEQYQEFTEVAPEAWARIETQVRASPIGSQLLAQGGQIGQITSNAGSILTRVTGVFSTAVSGLTNVLILVFVAFYFAYQPEIYVRGLIRLMPPKSRERAQEVLGSIAIVLRWWLLGRIFAMFIVGLIVGIGLWLIGVPLALILGVLAGLLSFVPIIGAVLAVIPALLVASMQGLLSALYVLLLYAAAQFLESNILTPLVQQRTVDLPPAVALMFQLLLGIFTGPLGVAVAFPLAVAGSVLIKMLYIEDMLGDPVGVPSAHRAHGGRLAGGREPL